jgi:hypothetical protein
VLHRTTLSALTNIVAMCLTIACTVRPVTAQGPAIQGPPKLEVPPFFYTTKQSPLAAPKPEDDDLHKLRKERYRYADRELATWLVSFANGGTDSGLRNCLVKHALPAELSLSDRAEDKAAAYARALEVAEWMEQVNKSRFEAGRTSLHDLERSRFIRLDLQIKRLEVKPDAAANELQKLRSDRAGAAGTETAMRLNAFWEGRLDLATGLNEAVADRLLAAQLALSDRPEDKYAAYFRAIETARLIEEINEIRFKNGRIGLQGLEASRMDRLGLQVKLLESKLGDRKPTAEMIREAAEMRAQFKVPQQTPPPAPPN